MGSGVDGALGVVVWVPSVWWCGCPRWCGWCPRCGGMGALGVVVWVPSVWCARPQWHICSRSPRRARHEAPQCGGGLACESMLQGEIEDSDCSNYQLFRCPSWDAFYRSVCRLKRWLLTFYRGERIIRNVRNTLNSDRFYSKIRNKKTISKEKYTKTI